MFGTESVKLKDYLKRHGLPENRPDTAHAAVLVPLGFDSVTKRVEIVLTKRAQSVNSHKGQVSFPGGLREAGDDTTLYTALRETEEELGIDPSVIEPLGPLPSVYTRGNLLIFPWVAAVKLPTEFKPRAEEVETVLYLPVKKLVVEGLKPVAVEDEGVTISTIGLTLGTELVWGATARILEHLRLALVAVGY